MIWTTSRLIPLGLVEVGGQGWGWGGVGKRLVCWSFYFLSAKSQAALCFAFSAHHSCQLWTTMEARCDQQVPVADENLSTAFTSFWLTWEAFLSIILYSQIMTLTSVFKSIYLKLSTCRKVPFPKCFLHTNRYRPPLINSSLFLLSRKAHHL